MITDSSFAPSERDFDFAESFGGSLFGGASGSSASAPSAPSSPVAFVWGAAPSPAARVCASRAALAWRAGVRAVLRFERVLSSGRVVASSVPVCSLRAAAFQCRAFCAGRGVLRCSCFLSDGRWVASAVA